ncbi:MAG: DUF1641 domain-containing protein [Deltaproteobacteria bacterium]|nr:DUF1641 domain-containing protein [Deltaproteobacteria bacterium]
MPEKTEKKPSKEDLILERLDRMEGQMQTLVKAQQGFTELKNDLAPLANSAFKIVLEELGTMEGGFQLEDFFALLKQGLRSVRNLTQALETMENVFELWNCMEPLLKSTVPNLINFMDNLERKGVFRTYAAMLEVRAKVASHYDPEEIASMSDAFVLLLSMLKKLSDPQMIDFMNRLLELPTSIKLEEARPLGPIGMLSAMSSKEARQGLGVAMELTKALGKLKADG